MPNLHEGMLKSHLSAIPEEGQQDSDVNYEHYVNNQNQKVNKMVINRNEGDIRGGEDSHLRPETSNYQNFNWHANDSVHNPRQTGMPPTTAAGANLWNQGHLQERYVDAELRKSRYGNDLREQMRQDEAKRKFQRLDDKVQDHHFLDEFYQYNPFGRGGGGAPLRDQFGNMITSRKPQFRNEYSKNWAYNRGPMYSVMSSARPMTKRAPTSYTDHFGKPRDLHTRNINIGSYHGGMPPQTSMMPPPQQMPP